MADPQNMPEEFLQYIWQNRLFTTNQLQTIDGDQLEIIDQGRKNSDSGPDFFNAKIKLNETTWAGNIEIHKKASDWQKHEHTNDKAYDNVILHVVETADTTIARNNGEIIPTLILNYPEQLKHNYEKLINAQTWIACEKQFHKVDPIVLQLGFNRLMIERLETKTQAIVEQLRQNNNNWEETFFQVLAQMFGFKVNAVPFELLAKSLSIQTLLKHKNSLFQLEALLFGNSGLLNQQLLGDDYYIHLRDEYSFLYKKYKLKGIEGHLWKFMRLRPPNFPTIRISQLAALIYHSEGLFSRILEIESMEELKKLFKVKASEYWDTHYNFNKTSKKPQAKELGDTAAHILIINVIVPFLFVYGENQNKHELKNRALEILENLPAESNSIISKWADMGIQARSAFDSQALLQLKNYYCESKKCLNCHLGVKLVSSIQNQDD
ncbi:DUF2851 family protein [Draconibacterium halophilum]|uniref:DUF2851 family protein n=1 Tax=Draconibacterium halophilum TaxID=2706887 RepID=A0A6C0RA51_9BACT|nr:DUF2851 family protein [Draconibacterium halophilum]QIA07270.1 DUF2851 family protein [Draconibacterium halophilum]